MYTEFDNYMATQTDLPPEMIRQISSKAILRRLGRNEHLLRAGDVCRYKTFIAAGMLRTYFIKRDGNEHILQFSPENTWTLDVESYDHQTASLVNIAAVEPTRVLLWQKADFDALLRDIPDLKRFSEKLISRSIYSNRNRILGILSGTPEERYEEFVNNHPDYLSRMPLRMIAAYLGISLKTLTRIRHAQLVRDTGIMDK